MRPIENYCDGIGRDQDRATCVKNMSIKTWYRSGNSFDPTYASQCQAMSGRYADECRGMLIKDLAIQIVNMSPNLPSEAAYAIQNIESPTFLIHFIASNLQIDVEDKQRLLETIPLVDRADLVMDHLEHELRVPGDLRRSARASRPTSIVNSGSTCYGSR